VWSVTAHNVAVTSVSMDARWRNDFLFFHVD
jgi:hypothetical protein